VHDIVFKNEIYDQAIDFTQSNFDTDNKEANLKGQVFILSYDLYRQLAIQHN
jgi:hypothetical protein